MSEVVAVLRLLRAAEMTLGSACDAAASARWAARVEGGGCWNEWRAVEGETAGRCRSQRGFRGEADGVPAAQLTVDSEVNAGN